MWTISFLALTITAIICAVGLFHPSFNDNLFQCLGMIVLVIACLGRAESIWVAETTNPSWMLVHVGTALYALGTFIKVLIIHGKEKKWPLFTKWEQFVMFKKSESGAFDSKPQSPWKATQR